MRNIYVKYNPYTVRTQFEVDGKAIGRLSDFYEKQEDVRLQEWIEPSGDWQGFYEELRQYLNSSEAIKITFEGTELDYEDFLYAYKKYGSCFRKIDFEFIKGTNDTDRLQVLRDKFDELKKGPIEELRDGAIKEAFEKALSSEFEVVVIAPMSSGKSTLINAILGTDILPAYNAATTATVTKIKDVDTEDKFYVTCKDNKGKILVEHVEATLDLINKLNLKADADKNIDSIDIQGNIPNLPSDKVNIVFVDTPGGNNSQDEIHKQVMQNAVKDENKGMVLFVFNYTQLETDDCDAILSIAAQAMKNATTGKQARDRFIFVCNKMDAQDPEKEPYEKLFEKIYAHLKKKGIEEPNLFLTCADACKLIRMGKNGVCMTESEEDRLDAYLKPFNRPSRRLFKYASVSPEIKEMYLKKVEEIASTGARRSEEVAEINSGIPVLEAAITQYITKYAQAIKVKTAHDIFMRRVVELDMKAKSEARWSSSEQEYTNMRRELEEKEALLEKDQKLQHFKGRVDAIKGDYSSTQTILEKLTEELFEFRYKYGNKVKKEEADSIIQQWHDELRKVGERCERELVMTLENCVYKQCKEILQEYKTYITELDRNGMLNIGDYNFRKISGFEELTIEELNAVANEHVVEEVTGQRKRERSGLFNWIKRLFGNESGWYKEDIKEDFVLMEDVIENFNYKLYDQIEKEVDAEIKRAKENEAKIKKFVNEKLYDIDRRVKREIQNVKQATSDKEALRKKADENKANMEWLAKFVADIECLLDV